MGPGGATAGETAWILTFADGEGACASVRIEAGAGRPPAEVLLVRTACAPLPRAVAVRFEWPDGAAASFAAVTVRRDEPGADGVSFSADSTGTALLRLEPGRHVVEGEGPDGVRFAGDGPLVILAGPAAQPAVLRIRPLTR